MIICTCFEISPTHATTFIAVPPIKQIKKSRTEDKINKILYSFFMFNDLTLVIISH